MGVVGSPSLAAAGTLSWTALHALAQITGMGTGFRSLGDAWADTTTPHDRLMVTVLGGLAEFERDLIHGPHQRGPGTRQGARRQARPQAEAHRASAPRGGSPTRS